MPGGSGGAATGRRKRDHLEAVLGGDVGFPTLRTGFASYRVVPRALPERDLADVDLSVEVFGRRLGAPLLISCMTGGVTEAGPVNRALAAAAAEHGVGLGLGSARVLLEDPATASTFAVRDLAPDALVLANLGAVQLRQYGREACEEVVGRCGADGLVLHLNAVQEAIQPGGDTTFAGLAARIAEVAGGLSVPVVVKEVGFGMSDADVALLLDAGVAGIDVAGAGGTNWARVEATRDAAAAAVAAAFVDWGRPTAECVRSARALIDSRSAGDAPRPLLVASGGVRDGVDALKALCLGASLVGMAGGLLAAAVRGAGPASAAVAAWRRQLEVAAWAAGIGATAECAPQRLVALD